MYDLKWFSYFMYLCEQLLVGNIRLVVPIQKCYLHLVYCMCLTLIMIIHSFFGLYVHMWTFTCIGSIRHVNLKLNLRLVYCMWWFYPVVYQRDRDYIRSQYPCAQTADQRAGIPKNQTQWASEHADTDNSKSFIFTNCLQTELE